MAQATAPVFQGTPDEQALAERVFEVMTRSYGALYASQALVRQTLTNLAAYLANHEGVTPDELRSRIDAVVRNNPQVFAREERDGEVIVATSRTGHSVARGRDTLHTFRERLYEPANPLPVDDLNNIVTTVRQVIPAPEPVLISPFWRGITSEPATPAEAAPAPVQPTIAVPVEPAAVAPPAPVPAAPGTSIVLSDGTSVDLAAPLEELLAEHGYALQVELRSALDEDPLRRIVSFGDRFYVESGLPTYGKNDMRRIRDYILEQGAPVPETSILTDLYRARPSDADFEIRSFALNYRLGREKDFEFVGTAGAHLWSAKGLPAIGGKRMKASDLGQLFAYLQDGYDDSAGDAAGDMVLHTLTFFEWEYGILPFDTALATLLPQPLLDDQRTAVISLRVEVPQNYSSYICEIRYPTGARGGWIWGLEEFFREYLVPGAAISLSPTEDPSVFIMTYEEAPAAEAKLLHFDEKRNRFAYMPVTYYVAVDEALLPSQAQYGKLRNLKALPINDRKKADVVLTHVFETVGEQLGSKEEPLYWITFDELYLAVNVLRPLSRAYLTHLLSSDSTFYADETTLGAWYYKPVPEETVAVAADEDEDEDVYLDYDDEE